MVFKKRNKKKRKMLGVPSNFGSDCMVRGVDKTKYLGININESLNWREQYKTIKHQTIPTATFTDKGKKANSECQVKGRMDLQYFLEYLSFISALYFSSLIAFVNIVFIP